MHITIAQQAAARKSEHLIVLATDEKQIPKEQFSKEELSFIRKEIKDKKKQVVINQYKRLAIVQILAEGSGNYANLEAARKAGAGLCARINGVKANHVTISSGIANDMVLAFAEGLILANYQFLKYKTKAASEKNSLKTVGLHHKQLTKSEIDFLKSICTAVYKTRDLVNEPPNFLTAVELGNQFAKMGKEAGFSVKVYDKKEIVKMNMGGLLSVNLGSIEPPTFTVMEYKPANAVNTKPYVLVGKGVVYDTGGMSLKPTPNSMDYMKCDMAGGAAVGGAMYAIAKAKLPVHIIALVPATDNRPDGNAYVPGDVITMMSGKTVEVLNTDAEGRLILADALHYAKSLKPELVLEFSTLTGAAAAAIGQYGIVSMGKVDDATRAELEIAGNNVYERLAEFPMWEEYDELLKSDIADLKNIGGPAAGAITAGRFLLQFTDYPYMHFDIAAPAFSKSNDSYRGKNGTGVGVRLITEFIKNRIK
ncbi:MAG: leucyl aminopeptidase family protein [Bacteroidota bacterium]